MSLDEESRLANERLSSHEFEAKPVAAFSSSLYRVRSPPKPKPKTAQAQAQDELETKPVAVVRRPAALTATDASASPRISRMSPRSTTTGSPRTQPVAPGLSADNPFLAVDRRPSSSTSAEPPTDQTSSEHAREVAKEVAGAIVAEGLLRANAARRVAAAAASVRVPADESEAPPSPVDPDVESEMCFAKLKRDEKAQCRL